MRYVKTEAGQKALKDRSLLAPRQRSAFILFDGKRSLKEVLEATVGLGVTVDELVQLVELGLLEPDPQSIREQADRMAAAVTQKESSDAENDRYRKAYPLAVQLTSTLGLRGFRLNLAVEGAADVAALRALLPKIRETVGADKCRELEQVLNA
jgi:hypothetical protein